MILFFVFISLLLVFILGIRYIFHDGSIPAVKDFCKASGVKKALFIFPHPDDETTCAGTISLLKEQNFEITLLILTPGEEKDKEIRKSELQQSTQILGIDRLIVGDFPNNSWEAVEKNELLIWNEAGKHEIRTWIENQITKFKPSLIFSYDRFAGGYGHPEHILCSRIIYEICIEFSKSPGYKVEEFYELTLPARLEKRMLGKVDIYQRVKWQNGGRGLPLPNVSVKICRFGAIKKKAVKTHASQRQVLNRLFPYIYNIPAWVYFRIWDREYFRKNEF